VTAAYEAVRAGALGEGTGTVSPGGVGVIMRSGVPAWLAVWAAAPPPAAPGLSQPTDLPSVVSAYHSDLVLVLASMALGHVPAVQS
jgi:hypothetical protein